MRFRRLWLIFTAQTQGGPGLTVVGVLGARKGMPPDSHDDLIKAYQAIIREGSMTEQTELLNPVLLRRVWPWLVLPARCRHLWKSRHPSLAAAA